MSTNIAVQIDYLDKLSIQTDTTFRLMLEACTRRLNVKIYHPQTLSLTNKTVTAQTAIINVYLQGEDVKYDVGDYQLQNLAEFDYLLIRQDPPFDMDYITATYLLEHLNGKVRVLNNPTQIRNAPEKLLMLYYPDLIPPTLISGDEYAINNFRQTYGKVIIKPLYSYGGDGIYAVEPQDDIADLLNKLTKQYNSQLVVQQYLPQVEQGDKRVIMINGEYAGAINRVKAADNLASNLCQGGSAVKTELTSKEHNICNALSPYLKQNDLYFVGLDIIGEKLTEINVTSPTGIYHCDLLNGTNLAKQFWDNLIGSKTYCLKPIA